MAGFVRTLICLVFVVSAKSNAWERPTCEQLLDVAVIGAGPVGSYAAYQLRSSGKTIGLFEYSDRIGGRVYSSVLPSAPDVMVELGAMRFHEGDHRRLSNVVSDLGLERKTFGTGSEDPKNTRFFWRGKSIDGAMRRPLPYNCTERERANRNRIIEYFMEELTGLKIDEISLSREQEMSLRTKDGRLLYTLSAEEALDLVASREGIQFAKAVLKKTVLTDGDVPLTLAVNELNTAFGKNDGESHTVTGGMSEVPIAMVKAFTNSSSKHNLHLNSQLISINRNPTDGIYTLTFKRTVSKDGGTRQCQNSPPVHVCARQVILAIPYHALTLVDWEPLRNAMDKYNAMTCRSAAKIFMSFDRPWWLEAPNSASTVFSDLNFSYFMDFQRSKVSGNYVAMVGFPDHENSLRLEEFNSIGTPINGSVPGAGKVKHALKNKLLEELSRAFGLSRSAIPEPISAVAQFWSTYPFGCTWRPWKSGYHWADTMAAMRQPSLKDEVYVIGSDYAYGVGIGWIEGGLETADVVLRKYFGMHNLVI